MIPTKPFVVPPFGGMLGFRLKPVLRTLSNDPCNSLETHSMKVTRQ